MRIGVSGLYQPRMFAILKINSVAKKDSQIPVSNPYSADLRQYRNRRS
jgi:hypothetical protein